MSNWQLSSYVHDIYFLFSEKNTVILYIVDIVTLCAKYYKLEFVWEFKQINEKLEEQIHFVFDPEKQRFFSVLKDG